MTAAGKQKTIIHSRTYEPVGECIYCGAKNEQLTEEHIIPKGIGGRLILPAASCGKCQLETTKFESKFQNNMIGDFRVRSGLVGLNRKSRRGKLRIEVLDEEGGVKRIAVPLEDYPLTLMLPKFPPPELILGEPWSVEPEFQVTTNKADIGRLLNKHPSGAASQPSKYHLPTFCRMLAKIGHSYAIAQQQIYDDIGSFTFLLPEFIRIGSKKIPKNLVGGDMIIFPPTQNLHEIRLWCGIADETEYLVCRLRLFVPLRTPQYHVVVGERPFTGKSFVDEPLRLR